MNKVVMQIILLYSAVTIALFIIHDSRALIMLVTGIVFAILLSGKEYREMESYDTDKNNEITII